jgi:hypothetical protein
MKMRGVQKRGVLHWRYLPFSGQRPRPRRCERSEAISERTGRLATRLHAAQYEDAPCARDCFASSGAMAPMKKMMRSWRSPRLLRIALRCSAPTQERKGTWGDTPHAPVSFCTSFGDAQDNAPQARAMERGNPSGHFIGSWCPARGKCSSQRPWGLYGSRNACLSQNALFHVRQQGFR